MIRPFRKSGAISERELELFRPKPDDGQPVGGITDSATLYRRCHSDHFDRNGDLVPTFLAFPNKSDKKKSGQSFLLKGIASAFHALHRNCNDGRPLGPGEWGVLELSVANIPKAIPDPESRTFYFKPIPVPYSTCKAHCELFCSDRLDGPDYVVPGKVVKTTFRIQVSRRFQRTPARLFVPDPGSGHRV
jgi:hypothetical protein